MSRLENARLGERLPVVSILLVNVTAFTGQLGFLRDHLGWILPGDIMFALALESVSVYLAYMAQQSLLSNDSSLRLRLASYVAGLTVGAMNYSHYAHNGRPTFAAVAVGLMSAASPWLWAIYARRQSRDALMAQGLLEPHALRLGASRWLWHPYRASRVMWHATWTGETDPREAIAFTEMPAALAPVTPPVLADMATKADAIRYAVAALTAESNGEAPAPQDVTAWLHSNAADLAQTGWQIDAAYVRNVMRRDGEAAARQRRGTVVALESSGSRRSAAGT